jgi:hypothetical protein
VAGICEHGNEPSGSMKSVANTGRSGIAEGYTVWHCTFPLCLTLASGFASV